MSRLLALVLSCGVHLAFVWALWRAPPAERAELSRPIEVELRPFRVVEARRAAPVEQRKPTRAPARRGRAVVAAAPVPVVSVEAATAVEMGGEPGDAGEPVGGLGAEEESGDGAPPPAPPPPPPPDTSAELLVLPRIVYPENARSEGVEGLVRLWVRLDARGQVIDVEIREEPGAGLGEVARKALLGATFKPASHLGESAATAFEYRYRFELF